MRGIFWGMGFGGWLLSEEGGVGLAGVFGGWVSRGEKREEVGIFVI